MSSTETPVRGGDVVDAYLAGAPVEDVMQQSYRWSERDTLETDPGSDAPIGEVAGGDYAAVADSEIWRVGDGRRAAQQVVPDPDRLAAMRRVASRVVDLQDDAALVDAMTEAELAEARSQARQLREQRRAHQAQMQRFDLDEEQAAAAHEQELRRRERQLAEAVAGAKERHRKAADPTHRLGMLAHLALWLPVAALVPGLLSIVLGASNAATELSRLSPATGVVNWLMEPMFSLGVLVILVAQWLGAVPSALHSLKDAAGAAGLGAKLRAAAGNGFFVMELALFALTVVLQVGIHYVGPGAATGTGPLVWFFVPLGLLISMALVPATATRLNAALATALREAENTLVPAPAELHGKNREHAAETPGGKPVHATVREPARRTKDEARAVFFAAVERGEIDPATDSVNEVAKALGTRWGNAREFIDHWRRTRSTAA
ncbi:hypothetical protein [Saccharopolyspora sp. 6V]|uniref:hypothetical protein n=1 Tax=Saccharopolyspora sp. 6V TaxID=2877239 RepID=UPI001CD25244|nr:hypothetical protein [Saccharopolyspora sp. 6V]MCA1194169.1 hypothetical protein [Saccharopolyspora sp. 6V]